MSKFPTTKGSSKLFTPIRQPKTPSSIHGSQFPSSLHKPVKPDTHHKMHQIGVAAKRNQQPHNVLNINFKSTASLFITPNFLHSSAILPRSAHNWALPKITITKTKPFVTKQNRMFSIAKPPILGNWQIGEDLETTETIKYVKSEVARIKKEFLKTGQLKERTEQLATLYHLAKPLHDYLANAEEKNPNWKKPIKMNLVEHFEFEETWQAIVYAYKKVSSINIIGTRRMIEELLEKEGALGNNVISHKAIDYIEDAVRSIQESKFISDEERLKELVAFYPLAKKLHDHWEIQNPRREFEETWQKIKDAHDKVNAKHFSGNSYEGAYVLLLEGGYVPLLQEILGNEEKEHLVIDNYLKNDTLARAALEENALGKPTINLAASLGRKYVLGKFLEVVDPDIRSKDNGLTPLEEAIDSDQLGSVQLLLQRGANPNGDGIGISPLQRAIKKDSVEIVRELLIHNVDVKEIDEHDLLALALKGGSGLLDSLKDFCINITDLNRNNLLFEALKKGDENAIELLREGGAILDMANAMEYVKHRINFMKGSSEYPLRVAKAYKELSPLVECLRKEKEGTEGKNYCLEEILKTYDRMNPEKLPSLLKDTGRTF